MSGSLIEFLKETKVGPDTLQHAARLLLAEDTGDIGPEDMWNQIVKSGADASLLGKARDSFMQDQEALDNAALLLLSDAWNRPGGARRVSEVVKDADEALPVIEVGIVAIAAMYIAYLHYTKGVKSEEETVALKDGVLTICRKRDLFGPEGPLSQVARVLSRVAGASES